MGEATAAGEHIASPGPKVYHSTSTVAGQLAISESKNSRQNRLPPRSPLIAEAAKDFADSQRLTAEGKLGEAGQQLEELKRTIDQLSTRR